MPTGDLRLSLSFFCFAFCHVIVCYRTAHQVTPGCTVRVPYTGSAPPPYPGLPQGAETSQPVAPPQFALVAQAQMAEAPQPAFAQPTVVQTVSSGPVVYPVEAPPPFSEIAESPPPFPGDALVGTSNTTPATAQDPPAQPEEPTQPASSTEPLQPPTEELLVEL